MAFGVVAAQVVWENDFNRNRPVWTSNVVFCVLQLVALERYPDSIAWAPKGWIYVLFLLGLLVIGIYGALRAWELRSSRR